ncbi:MAG: hypothetical protein KKE02_19655 [Alphaproteobacteria bacterium]|nr:hypothetical protein [Alphaproteobacteria bacterium]MBU1516604.1 hypothetical protein [Alphaproteobacteria bacterium]MBU2094360.1 hypothetical protein [Alphaproteobacteria bacterium]MBU2153245.1 hypothetical protein [Alphaproteobacteria bacterium]MBU2307531.1 hypothetical protein [Alphaproteobacteria bacterium]
MDRRPVRILLQTTIPTTDDDWSIARFSRLGALLGAQRDDQSRQIYQVTQRDRGPLGAPDSVLSTIDDSDFDQLWLFAVDTGDGLAPEDCEAISRFRARGGGLLVTRDHMDLGSSVCTLAGLGSAHHFHSSNPDPDPVKRRIDDPFTPYISWPNFHSGANGDFQKIEVVGARHPVLANPRSPTGAIRFLPSHPHEGGIGAPEGEGARVIAQGRSLATGARFNIAVAFEPGERGGPGLAQSTFHHFADYNWDTRAGSPSFVDEPPGDGLQRCPEALADTHRYALNVAAWLASSRPGMGSST